MFAPPHEERSDIVIIRTAEIIPRRMINTRCLEKLANSHLDNEVVGAGGALTRHAAAGEDVHVCILSDDVTS